MKENFQSEIRNSDLSAFAKALGATELGFSCLEILEEKDKMGFKYGISVVVKLSDGILNQIEDIPTQTYFSHYRTVNRLIDEITLRLTLFLEEKGYPSIAIPASQSINGEKNRYIGAFQHKTAATLAGLGWIGKSALLIHKEYGPRIRLGTVLTNAPVSTGTPIVNSHCGSCCECKKKCPAMAIEGVNWSQGIERKVLYNAYACSEHMKNAYQLIGRGAVCGLCMVTCPMGKKDK
ncbi:MAG: epoxyqueuosine reductase [Eubacteriaceae bacterium]